MPLPAGFHQKCQAVLAAVNINGLRVPLKIDIPDDTFEIKTFLQTI